MSSEFGIRNSEFGIAGTLGKRNKTFPAEKDNTLYNGRAAHTFCCRWVAAAQPKPKASARRLRRRKGRPRCPLTQPPLTSASD